MYRVSGFKFQVSAYFLPLRQGEYPQGEGVCIFAHLSPLFFTYPLRFARPPDSEGQSWVGACFLASSFKVSGFRSWAKVLG